MGRVPAIRTVALLAMLVTGCGGGGDAADPKGQGDGKEAQGGRFTAEQVRTRFRQVFGEPLDVLSASSSFTQLRVQTDTPGTDRARFGDFIIVVVGKDYDQANFTSSFEGSERRAFPELTQGVLLDDTGGTPKAVKVVGNVVLQYSAPSREQLLDARFKRLAQTIETVDDPDRVIEIPRADSPCERSGTDFSAGDVGTCRDGGSATTIVAGATPLALPGAEAKGLRWGSVASFADRSFGSGQRIRAQGRFIGVRVRLENTGDAPLTGVSPTLAIGRARFTEAGAASSYLRSGSSFPIQPGNTGTYAAAFDVGRRYAREASRTGRLLFGVDEQGALRSFLQGAPRVLGVRLTADRRVGGLPRGD